MKPRIFNFVAHGHSFYVHVDNKGRGFMLCEVPPDKQLENCGWNYYDCIARIEDVLNWDIPADVVIGLVADKKRMRQRV